MARLALHWSQRHSLPYFYSCIILLYMRQREREPADKNKMTDMSQSPSYMGSYISGRQYVVLCIPNNVLYEEHEVRLSLTKAFCMIVHFLSYSHVCETMHLSTVDVTVLFIQALYNIFHHTIKLFDGFS